MNRKITLVIIAAVFALLIGGASVMYKLLGDEAQMDRLMVQQAQTQQDTTQQDRDKTEKSDVSAGEKAEKDAQKEDTNEDTKEDKKIEAPDFTVYDAHGNEVKLSDYKGKPVVLNFWASWCGPCQMEMPAFNSKYLELEGQVHFLMVNMTDGSRETVDSAQQFVLEGGYEFPIYFDSDTDAAAVFGARALPTTFFIDEEGYIVAMATGAVSEQTLQRGIDMLV